MKQPGDPFGSINSDWVNPQYLSDRHLGTHTGLMLAGMAMIMFGGLHAIARALGNCCGMLNGSWTPRILKSLRNILKLPSSNLELPQVNFPDGLTRRAKLLSAVGTVIDDIRIPSTNIPKLTIATLRFTQSAKACILAAGGQVLTLDELALHAPPEATPSFLGGIGTKERL
ncbi:hypothetical protein D9757_014692 [Collybiopsis confluens]|uniref:Large ribosomal subunit protein uL15/eL18 domain-containing protein n=1 Tax=Collybiopsis confluens TaxID=2823264 RepID=A0A8H5FTA8_9AGAR|nr:hypothetical protein D9757_014692 [Collybiopsis confluens]